MRDDDMIAYLEGDDAPEGGEIDPDERAALDGVRALLAVPALWAEPAPDIESRVLAAVAAAAAAERATPTPQPAPDSAPAATARTRRTRGTRRAGRTRYAVIAAAVAVAAAVVLVAILARGAGEPAAGTRFAAALTGTPLNPNASGTADLAKTPSGWHIDLRADGLARRAGNEFYEAWMKRADGTLVPVGTFNDAHSVTLWSGVSPATFRGFTVTAEVADGNQASSGRRVLIGTLHQTH